MKERKYKEDWVNETRLNEKNGRPLVVPVYKGPWFERQDGSGKSALLLRAAAPLTVFLILIILYFRLDFPGATTLYVFLPAALSLFPALYWAFGVWGIFRSPDRMTRLQAENGVGRVLRSSAGCLILSGCALVGDMVLLLTGGNAAREWPGSLILLTAAGLSLFTVQYFRSVRRSLSRKENQSV